MAASPRRGLERFVQQRGHTVAELALARLLAHPEVTVAIAGADNPGHVRANVQAVKWCLAPEEKAEVDSLTSWWDGAEATIDGSGPAPRGR